MDWTWETSLDKVIAMTVSELVSNGSLISKSTISLTKKQPMLTNLLLQELEFSSDQLLALFLYLGQWAMAYPGVAASPV